MNQESPNHTGSGARSVTPGDGNGSPDSASPGRPTFCSLGPWMARWVESGRSWEHVPDEIASQTRCESDVDAIVAAAILAALTPEPQVRFSVRHDDDGRCPTVVELGAEVIDELAAGRPVGLVIDEAVIELRIAGGLGAAFSPR